MIKNIEKYYDLISQKYDEATSSFDWIVPKEIESILEKYNLIKDGLEVLDMGIGTGQTVEFLQNKNCNIYGVDISEKMLKIVKDKYPDLKTFRYDICDKLNNLFGKDKFNLVIAGGVLEFIKDIDGVLRDVHALLKEDSYFIFTYEILITRHEIQKNKEQYISEGYKENNDLENEFKLYRRTKEDVEQLLTNNAFKIIEHRHIKAFSKTEKKIPVYYGIVLVKK